MSRQLHFIVGYNIGLAPLAEHCFPGLPLVLRYTDAVRAALSLSMNTHHEALYCEGSEYISLNRFFAWVPHFEDTLVSFCTPIWFEVRNWDDLHASLSRHLKVNVLSARQVRFVLVKGPT